MSQSFITKLSVARTKADRAGRNQLSMLITRALALIEDVQGQPLSEMQESQYIHTVCAASACHGNMSLAIDLLKPDADMKPSLDETMKVALVAAAFVGNIRLMEALLAKGVRPVLDNPIGFPQPLQIAARQGHQDAVLLLLENATGTELKSWVTHVLAAAAMGGQEHIVHLLLEPRSNFNTSGCCELAVLGAAHYGHIRLFQILLEREQSNTSVLLDQGLLMAAEYGHAQLVRMTLEAGVNVDARRIGGPNAIQFAASLGRTEIVLSLLAAGATRNYKRPECGFDDALCRAASNGHQEVVQILLDAGEGVNGRNASDSPLHAAAANDEINMMRCLLERGADVHAHGCGVEAIRTAAARGYDLVVRLLVAEGISADGPGNVIESPMLSALMGGQTHIVKILTELGAREVDPAQTKYAKDFASGKYPKRMLFN